MDQGVCISIIAWTFSGYIYFPMVKDELEEFFWTDFEGELECVEMHVEFLQDLKCLSYIH